MSAEEIKCPKCGTPNTCEIMDSYYCCECPTTFEILTPDIITARNAARQRDGFWLNELNKRDEKIDALRKRAEHTIDLILCDLRGWHEHMSESDRMYGAHEVLGIVIDRVVELVERKKGDK